MDNRIPTRTTLTAERVAMLSQFLALGHTRLHACHLTRTPVSTFYRWLGLGVEVRERVEQDEKYRASEHEMLWLSLVHEVERSEANLVSRLLVTVMRVAEKDGKIAMRLLESLVAERWGRHLFVEASSPDNRGVVNVPDMAREMLRRTLGLPQQQLLKGGNGNGQEEEGQADTEANPPGGNDGRGLHDAGGRDQG